MQCSDIFFLGADICQLGHDQRKVNMLAREYCDDIKAERKPVILSHPMVMGLKEGQEKQSKSDPKSAIFMQDTGEEVEDKIKQAYCPPSIENNPMLNLMKLIIFEKYNSVTIFRPEEFGGNRTYTSYKELEDEYAAGKLHAGDLKPAISRLINEMIQPVWDHFQNDPYARELYNKVKSYQITR
ncbi:hypothetical protein SteCoe_14796 [Stentor coeruleus]|uniref:tyrosine--tRNA ligase n=1 Tax=Stentor coeruleus TaxID=5963 RepID=A0A1R2C5B3_9CILI|nr:hypothetical protein SteCoe_14796 [Stentor coeruleus]